MSSISNLVEKADNRATKIFGLGLGMAMAMLVISGIVGLMILILMAVQMFDGNLKNWNYGLWIAFAALFVPYIIVILLDYQFGEKLKAKGRDGWIRKIVAGYGKMGVNMGKNAVMALYTSNEGARKTGIMSVLFMTLLMGIVTVFTITRGVTLDNGAYDGLPKSELGAELVMQPEYYANSRSDESNLLIVPYIEDSVVSSNYLRLFIPYQPSRFNVFLKKQCPDSLDRQLVNKGSGLDCLSKFFAIQIDAQLKKQPLVSATDPKTGQRGLIAMIDIRSLSNGQHQLKVKAIPKRVEIDQHQEPKFHKIPFWK